MNKEGDNRLVDCKELSFRCRRKGVLGPFTFSAGAELLVLKGGGEAKCGLIEVLSGLRKPVSGTFSIAGQVSVFTAKMDLPEHWRAGECLDFYGVKLDEKDVGVPLNLLLRKASASERRYVALLAILHRPAQVRLLEDPLAGLDESVCEQVLATVRRCVERGETVIMTSAVFPFDLRKGERCFELKAS